MRESLVKINRYLHSQRNTIEKNLLSESEEERLVSIGMYNAYTDMIRVISNVHQNMHLIK